jgi:SprT protein
MQLLISFSEHTEREKKLREGLENFVPDAALDFVCQYLSLKHVRLKITRSRKTKFADFRASLTQAPHIITINYDLNKYAFLITLIHEAAHLECWEKNKNKVKPHGKEWKAEFRYLMQPFLKINIFPNELKTALEEYIANPAASSCTDLTLMRVLKSYNQVSRLPLLEDLPSESVFRLGNSSERVFRKGEKQRKLYKCFDLARKKYYLINPIAEVELIEQ